MEVILCRPQCCKSTWLPSVPICRLTFIAGLLFYSSSLLSTAERFHVSIATLFIFVKNSYDTKDGFIYACYEFKTCQWFNTLRPRQSGRRFADDTFKRIVLNENFKISSKISQDFVPKGPINNISVLVQIMAWRRPGDKPLSEPMVVSLLTHICVTRPQCYNCWTVLLPAILC